MDSVAAGADTVAAAPGAAIVGRHTGLVRRTVLVSLLTLASRVLGMLRETGCSALFGDSSRVLDALVTAWRVPNLFRRLLGEGALSTALQNGMTEADHDGGNERGRALFLATVKLAVLVLIGVCALMMGLVALLPDVDPLFGSAWLGSDPAAMRELSLRLLPFVVFVCVSALMSGALQVRGEFLSSNVASILLNAVWVGLMGWLAWRWGWIGAGAVEHTREQEMHLARILSWAALAAGVLQIAVQLPALKRHGLWLFGAVERLPHAWASAWAVFKQSAPLAFGAAIYQINVTIDGFMAQAMLSDGGATALNNATRVQQLPMGLLAVAATSAVFPLLRAHGHLRQLDALRKLHDQTQLGVLFLALPATFGLVALAEPIAVVLFRHGSYGDAGVERVAAALRVLALVVVPAGMQGLATRCYFALGDLRTPVRVSCVALVLNTVLNIVFVGVLDMDGDGFALATVTASFASVALLWPGLGGRLGLPRGLEELWPRAARMCIAALAAGAAGRGAWELCERGEQRLAGLAALAALGLAIAAGAAVYFAACRALRIPEWNALWTRVTRRFRGA
ncbi:MAG: murein biosynthesis integral membrane protein MurJ [Planctomycetota bacterium]|nr:MAG: murein biosynthesis integral membrane protein MurJ [Planctomycetota bacterium]